MLSRYAGNSSAANPPYTSDKPVLISLSNGTVDGNLQITGNLVVDGNTTLGDTSADTIVINSAAWTLNNNTVITRAQGEVTTGVVSNAIEYAVTLIGDVAGTANNFGFLHNTTLNGANPIAGSFGTVGIITNNNTGQSNGIRAFTARVDFNSSGLTLSGSSFSSSVRVLSTGNVTGFDHYLASISLITGAGVIATHTGLRVTNLGNANVTTAIGVKVDDFTNSTTMRGVQLSLSAGANKFNIYADGTAPNYMVGNLQLNAAAPTAGAEKLQVNGAISINDAVMIRTYTAFTNGAAAAAGTLTNAPAAGNPTKWIPINDNGTTRHIPAW